MIDALLRLDTELFLYLNNHYASWLDPIMVWVTGRTSWFPFYAVLIGWLGWRYRWQGLWLIFTIAIAVALGDQITSSILKPLTLRLRPCHVASLQPFIHPVLPCGGQYGFASSHAANTFAMATVLTLLLGSRQSWVKWLYGWAIIVSYSRIYVGAHYPLDVLAGAGVGVLAAFGCVWGYRQIQQRYFLGRKNL